MTDEKKKDELSEGKQEIKIDYDNIDVANIMDQIKEKIAAQPKKEPELPLVESDYVPFGAIPPEISPETSGAKSKLKALLLKNNHKIDTFFPAESLGHPFRIIFSNNADAKIQHRSFTQIDVKSILTLGGRDNHVHISATQLKLPLEGEGIFTDAQILERIRLSRESHIELLIRTRKIIKRR